MMAWRADEQVRGGYPDPSLLAVSGLDRMRAVFHNQMPPPPIHHLFGLEPVSASPAAVTFSMPCSPWLQTDAGVFFAGTAALVADAPLGGAVMAGLGPGQIVVTSDLSINFLRPVDVRSERLIARARPIEVGRTLGLAEGLVEDGHGRLVAHCTTRCFVISMDPPVIDELPTVEEQRYEEPDPYLRPVPGDAVDPSRWDEKSFLEILGMQISGDLDPPPFVLLLGGNPPRIDEEGFHVTVPSTPWFSSPSGTIYGGLLAYIADIALTGAVGTTLDRNEISAALDLKVQFLRPALPDGRDLVASAHVMHRGKSFAIAQAEITNADGKVVALATSSATIRKGRSWSSFAVADDAAAPEQSG
jgi:uncharacterized protein (TIGR00369 family)